MKAHHLWQSGFVKVHHLRHNMRADLDKEWRAYLLRVGDGVEGVFEDVEAQSIKLPATICAPAARSIEELVQDTFPTLLAMTTSAMQHGVRDGY